ncbi:MAG: winged helix-turn-helix transcriptional regulator [Lachnospiraceae bacterium]|nr:winged helix-turn-helix transcriptional regulator [Lachnospiraceae bacterium]
MEELLTRIGDFQTVADIFKQLSDTSRLRIFWLLCHSKKCVSEIAADMDMTNPAVSHHLRQLKSAGLIIGQREGKEVYYEAADSETAHELHIIIEQVMSITCPDFEHQDRD